MKPLLLYSGKHDFSHSGYNKSVGIREFACFAQFETSEVLGTVRDPSQRPVANAAVTLTNQATGIEAKTTTDASGNYDFFNVKAGPLHGHGGDRLDSPSFPLPISLVDVKPASAWMRFCRSAR